MAATTTFTLRISPSDHELLTRLAKVHDMSIADLSRQIIQQGIRRLIDPAEIEKALDIERQRLLKAAEEMRAELDRQASDTKDDAVEDSVDVGAAGDEAGTPAEAAASSH